MAGTDHLLELEADMALPAGVDLVVDPVMEEDQAAADPALVEGLLMGAQDQVREAGN